MQENINFIESGTASLYIRHIPAKFNTGNAILLFNSRSLCVESTMGIAMGSKSYGDYMADAGVDAFLIDLRGYGQSSPVEEQLVEDISLVKSPLTIEDYYQDITSAINYIKNKLGASTKISLVGFSYLGSLCITYSTLNPGLVDNIISINPKWIKAKDDPPSGYNFYVEVDEKLPYTMVGMDSIDKRFAAAQPVGKDFREPLWKEQAFEALARDHRSFDTATGNWKLGKIPNIIQHLKTFKFADLKSRVLITTSQYDIENPYFVTNRLYKLLPVSTSYFKVLPYATHLCVWEKSRELLYEWTAEFII